MERVKHASGPDPSEEELARHRSRVFEHVLDSAHRLIRELRQYEEKVGIKRLDIPHELAERVMEYRLDQDQSGSFDASVAMAVHSIWSGLHKYRWDMGEGIWDTLTTEGARAEHFLSSALRIGSADYTPSETDIYWIHPKFSAGVVEERINIGQLVVRLIDLTLGPTGFKKCFQYFKCFECVTSIIFCVNLSDYDLFESGQNQMSESLALFERIVNQGWALPPSIVLLFDKLELFREKIGSIPLAPYFPEYLGGADVNKATEYILCKFLQVNRSKLSIYPHLTATQDTGLWKYISSVIKESILQQALQEAEIRQPWYPIKCIFS